MTPSKTPFAGFEVLEAGDPLSSDGYYFVRRNPVLADRLAKIGAVTHRHNAAAAMADPTSGATLATLATGGSIPPGQVIYVTYTLLDSVGGETAPAPVGSVTTPAGYLTPNGGPGCAHNTTAGTLLAGNYSYAITVTDGAGGETTIGPSTAVTILPGATQNEVVVTGLTALTNAASGGAGAAGWRLWRKQGAGVWYLIGTGPHTTDGLTDNGIAGDCSVAPPTTSTTASTNALEVTVPSAGQPAGVVSFNVYASLDNTFTSPALLGNFPVADYDAIQTFLALTVTDGEPPAVSTCYPGAQKINAPTDIDNISGLALPTLPVHATVSADATLSANQHTPVDATAANRTMTLPTGQSTGTVISAEKTDSSSHTVSLTGSLRGVGAQTTILVLQHETIMLIADSAGSWWPLASHKSIATLDTRYAQKLLAATTEAAAYTFALADAETVVESTSAGAVTFTVPLNATVAFPVGTWIEVCQIGAGQVTIAGAGGVTLDAPGGLLHTSAQYATIRLRKRATDEWVLSGSLA